jgi:hypothetical protein
VRLSVFKATSRFVQSNCIKPLLNLFDGKSSSFGLSRLATRHLVARRPKPYGTTSEIIRFECQVEIRMEKHKSRSFTIVFSQGLVTTLPLETLIRIPIVSFHQLPLVSISMLESFLPPDGEHRHGAWALSDDDGGALCFRCEAFRFI